MAKKRKKVTATERKRRANARKTRQRKLARQGGVETLL